MTLKQQQKLKMYLSLQTFLKTNAAITATLPNFTEFMTAFEAAIVQIQTNSDEQQYSTAPQTETKNELREKLTNVTLDNSNKMQAYARYIKDTTLLGEVKMTESQLNRAPDMSLVTIARGLHGKINDLLQNLESYQLTNETQRTFNAAVVEFQTAISQTTTTKVERKESTRMVNAGIENADDAVDSISSVVEIVHNTQPAFYANYLDTIKVNETGGSLQVKGMITDADSKKPIVEASVTFTLTGSTKPALVKLTADKGGFNVRNMAEGVYTVLVEKTGYVSQTVSAVVTPDVRCEIELELQKI